MSFQIMMRSFAEQIGAATQVDELKESAGKVLMSATLMVSSAVAVSQAHAQQNQSVFPEQSAVTWGQMLGQVLGSAVGSVAAKGLDNRAVGQVVQGVSTEIGRNMMRNVVTSTYQQSGPSKSNMQDNLDNAALRAVFAFHDLYIAGERMQSGAISRAQFSEVQFAFFRERDAFAAMIRSASMTNMPTRQWAVLSDALYQPRISPDYVAELAQPMSARLNRPGGPGYRPAQSSAVRLTQLRSQVESVARARYAHDDHVGMDQPSN